MKINVSTLITYDTSSTCLINKMGWLQKRGQVNMNFQKAILCSERQPVGCFLFDKSIFLKFFVDFSPLVQPTFLVESYHG